MRHIIVDGYNVIRTDPRLGSLERVSIEHARDVLVQTLASSPRLVNDQVTVIFDGWNGTRGHIHRQTRGRIATVYSARGQTADEVIVDQATASAGRDRVVVVTNDVEVRERCRAAGCEVSGAENLLSQLPGSGRRPVEDRNDLEPAGLSTIKRGNPRRASKRSRQQRDVRF